MTLAVYQVDAFTDTPFRGNPAAVCILPSPAEASWMQLLAREMNLSETAFLVERDGEWDLRWFTPAVEVDLCGHATLASAHTLWDSGRLDSSQPARFHTRSGVLEGRRKPPWIELDFPALPPQQVDPPGGLLEALGVDRARYVGKSRFDFIVEVPDEAAVRSLRPDFPRLAGGARGVMVTARADAGSDFDFVSRFFAPGAGIDEDPVTGSAHCVLAPYWAERLGKSDMLGWQASTRGGVVGVKLLGQRVVLRGKAVTIFRADLLPSAGESWPSVNNMETNR